ncbi:MAG TPA: methyltransferase domain-containing protein [Solirubrobacteraceae bacterium]|nr:methyltransferase domain-containing protein [Solirubrobacteraceae bacterium]
MPDAAAPERTDPHAPRIFQRAQPEGVPPLELTGERTLPDIPQENYWFRRHAAVYEWIRTRVGGQRVVDMACGEGYGTDILARTAASAVGVDANADAFAHARAKYERPGVRFVRTLIDLYDEPCDAVVFLQTIEHVTNPGDVLERFRALVAAGERPAIYVSTPNVLTLAPRGAERSGNPWHVREYRAAEFRELCAAHASRVELYGLYHARMLALHEFALEHLHWDAVHARLGITERFYERFTPAISERDFRLVAEADAAALGGLDRALDFLAVLTP